MKYKFRTISIFYFITTLLIIIPIIGVTVSKLTVITEPYPILILAVLTFVISYLIAIKLTLGEAQIVLSNKKVEFLWIKKPILTSQNNESVDIENIESWKYRVEFQYSYFKIYNPSEVITIMRLPNWNGEEDDFDNFLFTFKKRIEKLNKKRGNRITKNLTNDENEKLIIDKEEEHYKSNIAKFFFFIYLICIVFGAIYVYNNWNTGKINIGIVLFGVLGCIFYISKYKKPKNKES